MGFLFNCLFPAADAPPAKAPLEGESKLQGDHSASTPTPSSPPPVEAVEVLKPPALTLSTIIIPTAPDKSFQITPRTFATISKDIGKVTRVATTSTSKNACPEMARVAFSSEDGKIYFIKPAIAIETNEANSNDDSDSPHSLVVPFQGPTSPVMSLEFSQDKNTKLLAAWENGKVMAFDAKDGSILYECKAPETILDCAFSKDGKRVVIGGGHGWMMFDVDNNNESDEFTSLLEGEKATVSVTFSDDDTKLAVGLYGGQGCDIYDTNGTKTQLLSTFCKGEVVIKVAFSPNKMILAVGSANKVQLFNVSSGDSIHTFQIKGGCFGIQFSNEGHRIFISTRTFDTPRYGMLYGYDVYRGTLEFEIKCSKPVFSIAILNDKTLLATVEDDYCKVINIAVKPTHPMEHERRYVDIAVSPNRKWIVFTYKSKGFKVYNTFNNKLVWTEECTEAYSVCFSPCSKKFACIADRAISICNMDDKQVKRIETSDYFDWIEFLEDGQHIGGFREQTSTAYVIKLDKDDTAEEQLPITTSTVILCACVVPQKNLFAIATKEEILFYNITDGQPNERITFKFNNDQDGTLQAMQFTSDGSKMVLCSNTQVHTYKFHSDQGVDSSSKFSTILPISQDEATKDRCMIISTDAKLAAFHDKDQNHFNICSLEESGTERGVVHQWSMHTEIRTMHFLPRLSTESRHCLVVTYGERTTTLEVTAKEGVIDDTSVLFRSLDVCIVDLISKHKKVLDCRNEQGKTLAECAIEQKQHDLLKLIIYVDPLLAWMSVEVLMYFINTSDETMLELIMIVFKCLPHINPAILEELTKKIPELAENGSIDIICYILEAGALNCPSGFAPGKTTYLNAFLNFDMFGSLLLDKDKPCDGTGIIPEASSFPNALNMYNGHVLDDTKRIQLITTRVLLPGLSSYAVLSALVDMDLSSGEEGEGSSVIPQHLKPFACQSLQSSIKATWYSWARYLFWKRALGYVFYMVCIICLEYTTTITWLRISVIAAICIGWCHFVQIEVHQLKNKLVFRYMYDFWNIWQILSLVLVPIYVCLNIVDMVISNSTRTTIFSQHEWFPGLVHLFTLINFLHYLRGIQKMSWILYALGVLIKKMSYFLFILLWILIAACFQLAKIPGAFDTKQPIHIFAETYLTAIFGAFESDPYIGVSSVVLTLFIILSLIFMIFMNAMIAFISEAFANILDCQKAILHREMACLIVEVYDSMSVNDMMLKEKYYKWVYKLFKQTDLNKMKSGETESDADGRRATKLDVQSVVAKVRKECGEMKMENAELKSSLERIEKALEKMISIE